MPSIGTISIGPVGFEVSSQRDAAREVIRIANERRAIPVRLANAYSVSVATTDPAYAELFDSAGLTYPDGAPIEWYIWLVSGSTKPRRVRGPTLFEDVLSQGRKSNLRHAFVGTTEATLSQLTVEASRRFEGLEVAGTYAPPFGAVSSELVTDIANRISKMDCDIVWVALGTPKQDFVAARLASEVGVPCVGVGAAFDFVAGTTREAPVLLQRIGLEWAYRFACEPRRLWRRYTWGSLRFLYVAVRGLLRGEILARRNIKEVR